ncbi:hypothetical protein FZ025_01025 [Xanthomonas hyacinthi]|uniref:hypothetical protein n=1 Tax=Xanthomonas hyacinthi TaxID=56455 RepID=UPI001303689F|nr:hypothetical protein [Xanthomonas hyacinthi]QGY75322.1 hypothetical protein FZ025_01025 [Xanthomonas hyacinthi]
MKKLYTNRACGGGSACALRRRRIQVAAQPALRCTNRRKWRSHASVQAGMPIAARGAWQIDRADRLCKVSGNTVPAL